VIAPEEKKRDKEGDRRRQTDIESQETDKILSLFFVKITIVYTHKEEWFINFYFCYFCYPFLFNLSSFS
jgi:hypothetical protein